METFPFVSGTVKFSFPLKGFSGGGGGAIRKLFCLHQTTAGSTSCHVQQSMEVSVYSLGADNRLPLSGTNF